MEFVLLPELSRLYAENCGLAILPPGWIHRKRNIDTSVLILGYQGEVMMSEESSPINIKPSTFCILSEGKNHCGIEKLKEKAKYYWIHFKTASPPQFMSEKEATIILNSKEITKARLNDSLLLPRQLNLQNSNVIREAFHELLYEQQNKSFTDQKYQANAKLMMIKLNEMVFEIYNTNSKDMDNKSIVNKIIHMIYENLTDPNFSVKGLADQMCYNPDYLNRHFKRIMKRSMIEYIIDKRIEYSLVGLIDSDHSLSVIARNSGFSSYRNFIRQFKLRKNVIPSEYRNRHRMMHITNK
ncbi:AraC family transcriptional regulator [Oceanispirochaeta sp.]|jgi:AraC-like DNA-binding protein|uniref:helix-turn-helix domain-containing protein n=1 Tax=Oceanispirochaeta sp. TaxID=2035350 RepID=UPI0026280958|nr:helix-turn-helix domain-containing protein [Oceanispirochaeta sp.]MDA3958283.1 AraC family transcriptional regulator [Oceanispirochaeta sp.]